MGPVYIIFSLKQKEGAGKTVLNLQQLQIENAQGMVKLEGIWQNLLQCKCQTAECKVLLQQEWLKISLTSFAVRVF